MQVANWVKSEVFEQVQLGTIDLARVKRSQ